MGRRPVKFECSAVICFEVMPHNVNGNGIECIGKACWGSQFCDFWAKTKPLIDFYPVFLPKGTSLRRSASFELLCVKISRGVWPVGDDEKKSYIYRNKKVTRRCYISPICREGPTGGIFTKLGFWGELADVINRFKFDDNRLRGLDLVGGRNLAIPIDFSRRR